MRVGGEQRLLIAPGERYDVIVDFSAFAGQTLTLTNTAPAPFPPGDEPDPETTGQLLQLRVKDARSSPDLTCDPSRGSGDGAEQGATRTAVGEDGEDGSHRRGRPCRLRGGGERAPRIVRLAGGDDGRAGKDGDVRLRRQLVLNEVLSETDSPIEVLLNNTAFSGLRESTLTTTPRRVRRTAPSTYATGMSDGDAHHEWLHELPRGDGRVATATSEPSRREAYGASAPLVSARFRNSPARIS